VRPERRLKLARKFWIEVVLVSNKFDNKPVAITDISGPIVDTQNFVATPEVAITL
jgi:hypothetical protein